MTSKDVTRIKASSHSRTHRVDARTNWTSHAQTYVCMHYNNTLMDPNELRLVNTDGCFVPYVSTISREQFHRSNEKRALKALPDTFVRPLIINLSQLSRRKLGARAPNVSSNIDPIISRQRRPVLAEFRR